MKPVVIVSTFPDRRTITEIADRLVRDKIAACVNYTRVSSVYSWEDKIVNEDEYMAVFKTSQKNRDLLKKTIADLHPYEVPEIAEIDVASINPAYMKWILDST